MALTRIRAQQISDIDYKQAVRVITLSNVTLSGGAPNTVDGVSLVAGDRILVAGQDTASQNGLYDVTTLGTGANGTWARTADGDATGEIQAGMIIMVTEGDAYKDSQWKLTTNNPIVIGTTPLAFEQNSAYAFGNIYANGTAVLANAVGGTVTFTAGDNIAITGNNTSKTVAIGVTGISLNSISNGTSNVNVVSSGGNVTVGVGGTGNVAVFAATGLYVDGIVSSTGNLSAANISTSGLISAAGNVTAANLTINNDAIITGNLTVNGNTTFINSNVVTTNDKAIVLANNQNTQANVDGAGIELGNNAVVSWTYSSSANAWTANVGMSAAGNITGNNVFSLGIVSAAGNITGNYFLGNGAFLTGIDTSLISNGNSSVQTLANANITVNPAGISNVVVFADTGVYVAGVASVSGNVTSGNLLTNGLISATGNITAGNLSGTNVTGTLTTAAQTNITAVGTLTSLNSGTISSSGNVTGANLITSGLITATGNLDAGNLRTAGLISATGNLSSGNILTAGLISATGNVTGNVILGNGTQLTGINAFGNIAVTGETTVSADSTSDTLTFAEGSGISITTDSANNTITIGAVGTDSIFATGGDMGTVTEAVTSEEDLGEITVAVTIEYDLGTIVTAGLIYPDQLVLPIYTVATLPSASVVASFIYVSDASGGAVPAFADGANWRRVTDRAIVT